MRKESQTEDEEQGKKKWSLILIIGSANKHKATFDWLKDKPTYNMMLSGKL